MLKEFRTKDQEGEGSRWRKILGLGTREERKGYEIFMP